MRSPSRQARRAGVRSRLVALVGSVLLLAGLVPAATVVPVLASHTTAPTSVTIAGSLQSELGCPGDWQPECAATHLTYDATDEVWQGTFPVPSAAAPVRIQGRAERRLGRELRRQCVLQRRQHRPDGRRRQRDEVLLLARFALGHEQPQRGDRHGRRQLPERDRLPGRLAARLPPVVAAGPGRQRRLHVRHGRDPGRRLRDEGGPQRSLGRLLSRLERRVHGRRGRGRHDHLHGLDERRHRRQRAAPAPETTVALVGSLQEELGCPGDWQPECAATELTLGADGVWRGDFTRARRQLGVQGRPERHLGRQLRGRRGIERREHRADAGRRDRGAVLLRRHDPLGHEQPQRVHRHGGRQLPERDRLPRRLGARLPALVAPGHRRERRLHLRHGRHPGRRLRVQGRPRRGLGHVLSRGQRRVLGRDR